MKIFISLLISFSTLVANADLVSKTTYGDGDDNQNLQQQIIDLYNDNISKVNSNLFLALSGFAVQNELAFMRDMTDQDVGDMTVDLETNIAAGGGKSSCCSHVNTTLVPIWASYNGSGAIQEIIGFMEVVVYVEIDDELSSTKLSIERIIPFTTN